MSDMRCRGAQTGDPFGIALRIYESGLPIYSVT